MIVFDLACNVGHRFEGWFSSSEDYAAQCESGLLTCPECGSPDISKSPMAPAVASKSNRQSSADEAGLRARQAFAEHMMAHGARMAGELAEGAAGSASGGIAGGADAGQAAETSAPSAGLESGAGAGGKPGRPADQGKDHGKLEGPPLPADQSGEGQGDQPSAQEIEQVLTAMAKAQAKALENSQWVGNKFAENVRAMHYGEKEPELVHGNATRQEAEALVEEGVEIAPLPFPVADADKLN